MQIGLPSKFGEYVCVQERSSENGTGNIFLVHYKDCSLEQI